MEPRDGDMSTTGSRVSRTPDPLLGCILGGKYRVLSVVARGGTGKVYRARQEPIGRTVAVKVMRPDLDPEGRDRFEERFLREASMAGQLQHPNVVTVHDFGRTDDGACFIVMEHLAGVSLKRVLKQGPMPPERALLVFEQIARGLRHAHRANLVHRDMKPGNVILLKGDDGTDYVKVLDFGLVKADDDGAITKDGTFLGTPHYVSPEQARGEEADARADLYSVGVMLYAALTGKLPFYTKNNPMAIAISHVRDPYPPMAERVPEVRVPAELERLVKQLMAKDREERLPDSDTLLAELKRVRRLLYPSSRTVEISNLDGVLPPLLGAGKGPESMETSRDSEPDSPRKGRGLGWLALGGVLLLGVPVVAGGVAGVWWLTQGEPSVDIAPVATLEEVLDDEAQAELDAAEAAAAALAAEPPPPRQVYVLLSSEPAGAEVVLDDEVLGTTPFARKLEVSPDEVDPVRTFVVRKSGYAEAAVELSLAGEEATENVALRSLKKTVRKPKKPKATASAVVADGVQFSGSQATQAVSFLNSASKDQLLSAGMAARQANIVIDKRPWSDVSTFAATPYIGAKTVEALRRAVD